MPVELSRADRRVLWISGGVLTLLTIVSVLTTSGSGSDFDIPTSYSSASSGARAAYLLLEAAGYRTSRWERPLTDLADPAGLTLVLAEPESFRTAEDERAIERFLAGGGRVIATGRSAALYLPKQGAVLDPGAGLTWKRIDARAPSPITRAAPAVTIAPQAYWLEPEALPLYGDDSRTFVVEYPYGAGQVIWWGSATPLTNAGIREPGNLEFFVACTGAPDRRLVLWDEYVHGHRPAAAAYPLRRPLQGISIQLFLLAIAAVVTYSRRSGPVIPPVVDRRRSPLEFVRTLGGLYARAGATSVAVDIAYRRFRYWLTRRLGVPLTVGIEELERGVRARWKDIDPAFGATLRECEAASGDPDLPPRTALRLTRLLHEYAARLRLFGTPYEESD